MAKQTLKEHRINRDWCKGCGICVHFCPKKVLELDSQEKAVAARPEDCICCRLCELRCPDLAIEVITEPQEESAPDPDPDRSTVSAPVPEPAGSQESDNE